MQVSLTTSMLLLGVMLTAERGHGQTVKPAAQCVPILEIELVLYPGTDYSKVDNVKACEDGELVAFHAFSAPGFGKAAAGRRQGEKRGKRIPCPICANPGHEPILPRCPSGRNYHSVPTD